MSNLRKTCILPAGKLLTKSMAQIMNFLLNFISNFPFTQHLFPTVAIKGSAITYLELNLIMNC